MKRGLALTEEDLEVVGAEEEDPIMVAEVVIKIGLTFQDGALHVITPCY
jgi:hypothetical protein